MQDADARMIQRGDGAGITIKTLLEIGIPRKILRKDLDRDDAIKTRVFGSVDFAHPASPYWRLNFVRAKFGTRRQRHEWTSLFRPVLSLCYVRVP
jgi:hypothetical protein